MTTWPVSESPSHILPASGPGSYSEDRGDRRHCGIDIYAPEGSEVVAMAPGRVHRVDEFTSPERIPYWNVTYEVVIEHEGIGFVRYAELGKAFVREGSSVDEGQPIGSVGLVLNSSVVDGSSPIYIRELVSRGAASMLHLELHDASPDDGGSYLGGNWMGEGQHPTCMDPAHVLDGCSR